MAMQALLQLPALPPSPVSTCRLPRASPCPAPQPEAALPPPFPTTKPRRTYVSNIATLPQHRRKGVATELLRRCERQARLWRRDSLWLHVEIDNAAARQVGGGWQRRVWCWEGRGLVAIWWALAPPPRQPAASPPGTQRAPPALEQHVRRALPPSSPSTSASCTSSWGMQRWGGTLPSPPTAAAA